MDQIPKTRYVSVGGSDVAYQVVGDGPVDLVYFNGGASHIDLDWDSPAFGGALRRLASFSRLIRFDRRGAGASDPLPADAALTWEDWVADLEAVLDAAGSERTALFAILDAGPIAMLFAATRPERTSALILANTSARFLEDADYPIGLSQQRAEDVLELISSGWGTEELLHVMDPALDGESARRMARANRAALTPRGARDQYRYVLGSADVRAVLPLIRVPTLVLHAADMPLVPLVQGRYVADGIPGATFLEVPGADVGVFIGHTGEIVDAVAEFITGQVAPADVDRILATVLFTDIVGSTERAASLGDRGWRLVLDRHDKVVRGQLQRFRGREVNTTGDGFVASFDGPARAIGCARAIVAATAELGIDVRAGLHTGECDVRGEDLAGLAVHIAARVGALAGPRQVLVSRTVKDLVAGSGIEFADRGDHKLKGVPDTWRLFSVTP
ncbi:MAG: adenylate/guanylate cyclase domain-containing protein [Acidimicrobiales bacterium]